MLLMGDVQYVSGTRWWECGRLVEKISDNNGPKRQFSWSGKG